ncbi:MAG: hypothetical protein AAF483_05370 [Planctomycetota bacterium]
MQLGRRGKIALILCVLGLLITGISYSYEDLFVSSNRFIQADDFEENLSAVDQRRAGWPFCYLIELRHESGSVRRSFHWLALAGNLTFWMLAVVLTIVYEKFLRWQHDRRSSASKDGDLVADGKSRSPNIDSLALSDIFVFTLLVALCLFYWSLLKQRAAEHKEMANRILLKPEQQVERSAYLPKFLKGIVPIPFLEVNLRIHSILLVEPTDQQLTQIMQVASLKRLHLKGDGYDLRSLDRLTNKFELVDLRVSERQIDSALIETLAKAKQLQSLNLSQTNVSANDLESLGEMPMLERLDVMNSPVQLDKTLRLPWANSLIELRLPSPSDKPLRHEISGLKQLVRLRFERFKGGHVLSTLSIKLSNLPSLSKLEISERQPTHLDLDDLPELKQINALNGSGLAADSLTVRSLQLGNLMALERLIHRRT